MANTVDSDLYGVIVSEGVLRALQADVKPFSVFATNFSPQPSARYGNVVVPLPTAPNASTNFVPANGYVNADATISERTIALSGHKYQRWTITDLEATKSGYMDKAIQDLAIDRTQKLLIDVFSDVLSVVTAANYGDTSADKLTVTAAAFDRDDLVDLAALCDTANWPDLNRSVLLASDYWRAVTKDDATAADVYGAGSIRQGAPNGYPMDGFSGVWRTNSIPANGQNLKGFACLPNAIGIVNRYLAPLGGGGDGFYTPIVDPQTGFTLGYREFYDNNAGARVAILECLYGFQIGIATGIKRIVSA